MQPTYPGTLVFYTISKLIFILQVKQSLLGYETPLNNTTFPTPTQFTPTPLFSLVHPPTISAD